MPSRNPQPVTSCAHPILNPATSYATIAHRLRSRWEVHTLFTTQARDGLLDPLVGRDAEVRRAMQILVRRRKNNPVLIGDPGVGKTAIAEGLAQMIANDDVPPRLKGKRLLSLELGLLVADTKYRGEFEQRLKDVIEEVRPAAPLCWCEVARRSGQALPRARQKVDALRVCITSLSSIIGCVGDCVERDYFVHRRAAHTCGCGRSRRCDRCCQSA